MRNSLIYQSYVARIEFSSEDECCIGHIAGIKDVVGFHGETVSELKSAFEEAAIKSRAGLTASCGYTVRDANFL